MRRLALITISLLSIGALAQGDAPAHSALVDVLAKMPAKMQVGTFEQQAFEASVESAVDDPSLDFAQLNPLLEADLKDADVRVRRYAALVISQLSPRRRNSAEELGPVLPSILASLDDQDRGVRLASIVAATGLHPSVPDSMLAKLLERFGRKDVNQESLAYLAGALAKISPNDSSTDAVLVTFLKNPKISDPIRALTMIEVATPNLSNSITSEIANILSRSPSDQVKLAAVSASEKVGVRAVRLEQDDLRAIQRDTTNSTGLRDEASRAIGMLAKQ